MKEFKHETIIIEKKGWQFLRQQNRINAGCTPLSQEQLEKAWDRIKYRNSGANPDTHPIAENEIRISPDSFGMRWDNVKFLLKENGFKQRQDGYEIEGFYL